MSTHLGHIDKMFSTNTSGEKYIFWDKKYKKWSVVVSTGKLKPKQKRVGRFQKLDDAIMCRDKYLSEME